MPEDEGIVDGFKKKACTAMRCRDCGILIFKVKGYKINEKVCNYLFYRTNFGDFNR